MRLVVMLLLLSSACRFRFDPLVDGGSGGGPGDDDGLVAGGEPALQPRLVFATQNIPNGAIGGLSGADTMCMNEAAGHAGVFVAVLGAVGSDPKTRLLLGQGRDIVLANGTKVATDATFFSAVHLAGIDVAIDGTQVTGIGYSWTNFMPDGTALATDCVGWTNSQGANMGGRGFIGLTDATWTVANTVNCNAANHLYCLEQ
jgi:hypothetical protein